MRKHFWTPSARLVVAVGLMLVFGAPTAWMLLHGTRGAEIANVLALPISMLGVAVSVSGFSLRPQLYGDAELDAAARALVTRVASREAAVLQRLLSDTGQAVPADLHVAQPAAPLVRWRTDGGGPESSLRSIVEFYTALDRGRLVVLGEPGAGKTVLAIQLLLDLTKLAHADPRRTPVPIRLSLPAFPSGDVPGARLTQWITNELVQGFGLKADLSAALVDSGRILPVLDGLDEMDGDTPRRAINIVTALNTPHGPSPRPFVLTCRTDRYRQLEDATIQDCTVVVTQPLGVDQVVEWLKHRFPDRSQRDGLQRRWLPVVTQLRRRPRGALARTLSSPLGLYLAVTTYRDPESTPKTLCDLKADEVLEHLLSRLVDAATAQHPWHRGTRLPADQATVWLQFFAERLARVGAHGGSSVDLHLEDLLLGDGRVAWSRAMFRLVSAAATIGLVLVPLLLIAGIIVAIYGVSPGARSFLYPLALVAGALAVITLLRSGRRQVAHREFDRKGFKASYLRLSLAISGFVGTAALSTDDGLAAGIAWTVTTMGMCLLAGGFASGGDLARNPTRIVRSGLTFDVTVVAGFAVLMHLCATVVGVVTEDASLPAAVPNHFHVFLVGAAIGLVVRANSPWPRYLLFVWRTSRAGHGPHHLTAFFDWTVRAGVTRIAGTAIQFRHKEFQEWLLRTGPSAEEALTEPTAVAAAHPR